MKLIVSFLVIMLLFTCCKKNQAIEDADTFVIEQNIENKLFDWPKSLKINELIPLETNDECLIGSANKIVMDKDKIYILDKKSKSLLVFSERGRFLFKINAHGNGPEEYLEIRDFCFNFIDNEILILDYKKILSFDMATGKFIKKINLNNDDINPMQFLFVDKDLYYLWNGNTGNKDKQSLFLWDTKRIKGILPLKNHIVDSERFIGWNGDSCVFLPPCGDFHIYEIEKDKLKIKYYIDFGKLALPETQLITRENLDEMDNNSYFKRICNVRETSKWMYLLAVGPNAKYHEILINKESKEVISGKFNFQNSFHIVYADDNAFYASSDPIYILEAHKESMLSQFSNMEINEFDNPVIIKFTLK
jgi:hypothetical protein